VRTGRLYPLVMTPRPTFFATAAELRGWLEAHHLEADELWVGYRKRGTGLASITWPESVDQALCFGWIDGVRRSLDEQSYAIRFTPRRARSFFSQVNLRRFAELEANGLVQPAGRRAFEARAGERSGVYSYEEQERPQLTPAFVAQLHASAAARRDFESRPPWYQRAAVHWVMTAKKEETRIRRMATLIECSAAGRTIPLLTRPGSKR
jgi:uncharacterized protein YdeI (YjbR/CyaY-like superfamily)